MIRIKKLSRSTPVRVVYIAIVSLLASACLGIPDNATAVTDFEVNRYLGTWYEVARLDHRFERGLSQVQAIYSKRDDGGIRVVNRGYDVKKGEWSQAEGKAYFVGDSNVGRLKVSFFGPFYGAYNIVELDKENYQYAMVIGPDTDYLWILARKPSLDSAIIARLTAKAVNLGFPTADLIYVEHDKSIQ